MPGESVQQNLQISVGDEMEDGTILAGCYEGKPIMQHPGGHHRIRDLKYVKLPEPLFSLQKAEPPRAASGWLGFFGDCLARHPLTAQMRVIPIVPSHVSTSPVQRVIGSFVGRRPKAWPPCAYK